jgi:hypothetical protein
MNKLITLVSVIGSVASVLGLYLQYHGPDPEQAKQAWSIAYGITGVLTMYVLFVPGNRLEENVESKITDDVRTYQDPTSPDGTLCVQEGELTIKSYGPLSVKFTSPFQAPPEVEIVNDGGEASELVPAVSEVTRFQFVVTRRQCNVYRATGLPFPDKFKWVATGTIMQKSNAAPHDKVTGSA